MDELFDHIKAIKINREYLIGTLIFTEILGIITLIWYLRSPLTQKFLTKPPQAYAVSSFNPQTQYLVSRGDLLTGNSEPNSEVRALITPGFLKSSVRSTPEGSWWFQIPQSLKPGVYTISFGNLDSNGKLTTFQSYKVRVQSNMPILNLLNSFSKSETNSSVLDQFSPEDNESLFKSQLSIY